MSALKRTAVRPELEEPMQPVHPFDPLGDSTPAGALALPPGRRVGPYKIRRLLGSGGMGQVYRAEDPRLGREVAIKILFERPVPDGGRRRRLEEEARAVSALNHPNILTVHDLGYDGGRPYIVSELVRGETVREILERGPVPVLLALEIVAQTLAGLARAHETGIIHRDIKPENLMWTVDGFVKILDFGLARRTRDDGGSDESAAMRLQDATEPGTIVGTAGYMSPEQVRSEKLTPASDLFAVGVLLYEMLTGRHPFERGSAVETLTAIVRDDVPSLADGDPGIPARVSELVSAMLAKKAKDRPQGAKELEREVRATRRAIDRDRTGARRPVRNPSAAAAARFGLPSAVEKAWRFGLGAVLLAIVFIR